MKLFLSLFFLSSTSFGIVNGREISNSSVQKTFGINLSLHRSIDTPEIPIGPRVAITCGHCATNIYVYPQLMKAGAALTNKLFEGLTSGFYGLSFFKEATYPYDLALIILPEDEVYRGPYASISKNPVRKNEKLFALGMGKSSSTKEALCSGYDSNSKYSYGVFKVLDFYSQGVGFISTGFAEQNSQAKPVTCYGDSGAYYFNATEQNNLELVGINSWGTEGGYNENPRDGVILKFEGFLSGAGDLTSAPIQQWLKNISAERGVEICGVTRVCDVIKSPF